MAKQSQLVPNAPAGPPTSTQFSRESCKSPGNALHWSLLATFAPAALPQLDSFRPMRTVCPTYPHCPTALSATPCSLPGLAASIHCPHFRKSRFSVRLRSSQIVWDRLRSSQIVRAHPPSIPEEAPKSLPETAFKKGELRVIARQNYDPASPPCLSRADMHVDSPKMTAKSREERPETREKNTKAADTSRHRSTRRVKSKGPRPHKTQKPDSRHVRFTPANDEANSRTNLGRSERWRKSEPSVSFDGREQVPLATPTSRKGAHRIHQRFGHQPVEKTFGPTGELFWKLKTQNQEPKNRN